MADKSNWRLESDYDLANLNRSDVAWEFLRRNPEYQNDYKKILRLQTSNNPADTTAAAMLARHWGLNCCRRPETAGTRGKRSMAPATYAVRRVALQRAGRFSGRIETWTNFAGQIG
jgi:hypothetical protein